MINVQIEEAALLNLFMDKLGCWTTDSDALELYEQYLTDLIDCGCFENEILDVDLFIDNLFVNDTRLADREELIKDGVELDDCDKILASNEDKGLYLVSAY